jgi:hypothetical protein
LLVQRHWALWSFEIALRIADARVATRSPSADGGASHATWTKVFAQAMDELSKPLLNGSNGPGQPVG